MGKKSVDLLETANGNLFYVYKALWELAVKNGYKCNINYDKIFTFFGKLHDKLEREIKFLRGE